jgi:ABC-type Fe3+/spermidine/putrescine transport system ATPase subunit
VTISVRPERLNLVRARGNGESNYWEGRVASAAYYGDHREYEIEISDERLKVMTSTTVSIAEGERIFVACDPSEMVVVIDATA